MRRLMAAGLAFSVLAACAPLEASVPATESVPTLMPAVTPWPSITAAPPAETSGVRVTAIIGPTCAGPVRPDQVCTQPYEGEFVVTDQSGREIARFVTDQQGRAVVALPPGNYVLVPKIDPQTRLPTRSPVNVSVLPGDYVEIIVEFDTGLR